jgi:hypothetical protein
MVRKENKRPNELGTRRIIDIKCLELNEGQIVGIPKNPRYLKGEEHDKLKKSLKDSPELLQYKPLMIYAIEDNKFVVICGNMRLRICQELHNEGVEGFDALPCFVLNKDVSIYKIKEYAIKDNVQAGNWDWDELANGDWEVDNLLDWGVDCSFLNTDENDTNIDELFEDAQNIESKTKEIKLSVHIPQDLEEKVDEIKEIIKSAVSEYEGVEIK